MMTDASKQDDVWSLRAAHKGATNFTSLIFPLGVRNALQNYILKELEARLPEITRELKRAGSLRQSGAHST